MEPDPVSTYIWDIKKGKELTMPKYSYNFRLKATPPMHISNLREQEMPTLRQALDYLEPMRHGTVTTWAMVRETGASTIMRTSIEFKDTIGRSDDEIWHLFDKSIDAKLTRTHGLSS
jgi:hypothetical protein